MNAIAWSAVVVREAIMTSETLETLRNEAKAGLRGRVTLSDDARAIYEQRIDVELGLLGQVGVTDAFVNVRDLLDELRRSGVRIGIAHGPCAASLVAFALGMSDVDPVAHGFFIERFINPLRPRPWHLSIGVPPLHWNALIDIVRARLTRGTLDPHLDIHCYADKAVGAIVAHEPNWPETSQFPPPYGAISNERIEGAVEALKDVSLPGIPDADLTLMYLARPRTFEEFAAAATMSASTSIRRVRFAEFVQRRDVPGPWNGIHPAVDAILCHTRGIQTFHEQAITVAMVVGGFDACSAELLRWGNAGRRETIVRPLRDRFLSGAATQGFDPNIARGVFTMLANEAWCTSSKPYAVSRGITILAALDLTLRHQDWWRVCADADQWPNGSARADVRDGKIEIE